MNRLLSPRERLQFSRELAEQMHREIESGFVAVLLWWDPVTNTIEQTPITPSEYFKRARALDGLHQTQI